MHLYIIMAFKFHTLLVYSAFVPNLQIEKLRFKKANSSSLDYTERKEEKKE